MDLQDCVSVDSCCPPIPRDLSEIRGCAARAAAQLVVPGCCVQHRGLLWPRVPGSVLDLHTLAGKWRVLLVARDPRLGLHTKLLSRKVRAKTPGKGSAWLPGVLSGLSPACASQLRKLEGDSLCE